jgi:hypothetical protein
MAPTEEPLGLPLVALSRGAEGVVGGLWLLPDDPTARILGFLYERIRTGVPLARALRDAQLAYAALPGVEVWEWAGLTVFRGLRSREYGQGAAVSEA